MATAPSDYVFQDEFTADSTYETGEAVSLWKDAWRRLTSNYFALFGLAVIVLLLLVAIVSQFWTPYPTWKQGIGPTYGGPSAAHPFGLDQVGRDILSRLMGGAAIALAVGLGTALLSSIIGIALGLLAGFYRGWVDTVISLLINVWYGIPDLLVVMLFVVIINSRELKWIIVAISITAWLNMARLVRGQTLALREREFVEAARSIGTRDVGLLTRHILPNALGPIIVQATYLIPAAILFEAFLSFLGLGAPPPEPSWGAMCAEGYKSLQLAAHVTLVPAFALAITLIALNAFGDGLRDALDPRMRR
ncbi:MAG: ABC transporter permease [Candidatus Dormibacter sp.]|uniref:ABC transporter permease n=1 Tax=Candidatus Dormibacter sp. TaxID=2973982 RepID=UPI000DB6485A|nr:MAG: ABC transporter permease [Candidatus Dormibacteraeota bacterium]